ncbi:glycosyltransferase family 2 protein [Anabaena cylindrica FACHB-243]|uniref:Glycosyl transferase family 2 n=1 Tax=Anabaena cylindrica (strain ATCC 27899 / PCC 7122) TaxID=272123 RepID=K9Z8Y0_ANACC|nr:MULTISPECIES: hormogonium polysaccharide biosynthesis glycosyltransferase HpsE [Anabaena]AFZ55626.1 glycosyl transferase family 2 [Anabaena cylindrica PCC 7122]MBD2420434.1 glycosyltransferase family 2 protein [Anabaena cylindrica FACHB-243]MBY5281838.1 glycosyltransferase family 2 protein [Anabaena sp. CCAP 1446/1C]MBY5310059.1 glycosyltransferase family 2 protein [Anabaena sp. CCAP 1446/1C]MCM2406940.1 hormogonium polysaccharide biosynthesis glycosyltransferase HpsE [Anabaena sp. CCAP 144
MVDFTVAICTYNGENRILDVLEKLRSQVGTEEISWEILIIDNNSTDNTAKIVQQQVSNWSEIYPLEYYFEAEQGLAFARRCAIREAKSDLIGFLDDDNLPYPNWVAEAYKFGQTHENAGAYGGQIHGKFEVEPPPGFGRIARYFAILEGNKTYCYNEKYQSTKKRMFPPGAGIVIRKQAWLESVPERQQITGVSGNSLLTKSEDVEMLSYIFYAGWELWFNKDMNINHKIPKSRFERGYIIKFFKGVGLSRYQTRMIAYKPWQFFFVLPAYMVNDVLKIMLHLIKYSSVIKTDIVAAGEMELLISIFISPFYHWKKKIFHN